MAYRYIHAEYLFTGEEIIPDGVLVLDAEGVVADISYTIPKQAEYYQGILSPGFINCHCHLELSGLRGEIAPGSGMVDFLLAVMKSRQQQATTQEPIRQAMAAMRKAGIVAVGDICNTADTLVLKQQSGLTFHNFIEATGFIPENAAARFAHSYALWQKFSSALPGQPASIVPHAPYSVSEALLQLISGHSNNRVITMHNQESAAETEFLLSGEGELSRLFSSFNIPVEIRAYPQGPELVNSYFRSAASIILVHNVFTTSDDLRLADGENVYWCLCPNANRYIGNPLPPVSMFYEQGVNLVLGTDSLASNDQLCIHSEMQTIAQACPDIPIEELLKWATLNGARALGIADRFGSFAPGRRPGMVRMEYEESTGRIGKLIGKGSVW